VSSAVSRVFPGNVMIRFGDDSLYVTCDIPNGVTTAVLRLSHFISSMQAVAHKKVIDILNVGLGLS
jgi:hypothetical protein